MATSPLCIFCEQRESESLEHLFITCSFTKNFWLDLISWCNELDIYIIVEKLLKYREAFWNWQRKENFPFLNHNLILAKQHIYVAKNAPIRHLKSFLY